MDTYTLKTQAWLDERFRETDQNGIYRAHQPIYGFRRGPCEFGQVSRYIRTYHILRALSRLRFQTLLDVGAAEGFKAAVARDIFGIEPTCSDLSGEACKRCEEIFKIRAVPADVHELPFKDAEFDVVLCSETLEHVTDYKKAAAELLRVSSKAVIVTVPHEPEEHTEANAAAELPHAHIHSFDTTSFDYLKPQGLNVHAFKVHSKKMAIPAVVVDALPVQHTDRWKFPKVVTWGYNLATPLFRVLFGKRAAAYLMRRDEEICQTSPTYEGLLFVLLKDPSAWRGDDTAPFSPMQLLNFAVPRHSLRSAR